MNCEYGVARRISTTSGCLQFRGTREETGGLQLAVNVLMCPAEHDTAYRTTSLLLRLRQLGIHCAGLDAGRNSPTSLRVIDCVPEGFRSRLVIYGHDASEDYASRVTVSLHSSTALSCAAECRRTPTRILARPLRTQPRARKVRQQVQPDQ